MEVGCPQSIRGRNHTRRACQSRKMTASRASGWAWTITSNRIRVAQALISYWLSQGCHRAPLCSKTGPALLNSWPLSFSNFRPRSLMARSNRTMKRRWGMWSPSLRGLASPTWSWPSPSISGWVLNPPKLIAWTNLSYRKRKMKVKGKAQSKSRLSVSPLMLSIPTSIREGSASTIHMKPKRALSITSRRMSFTKVLLAEEVIFQPQIFLWLSLTLLTNLTWDLNLRWKKK